MIGILLSLAAVLLAFAVPPMLVGRLAGCIIRHITKGE